MDAPGAAPEPLQVGQVSWRVTLILACVPRMACQKSMLSAYSRSAPFSGCSGCCSSPRWNKCEKMSENPPPPLLVLPRGWPSACAGLRGKVIREIESAEIHVGRRLTASRRRPAALKTVLGVEADLVVHLAFLGIAQDVISFLHVLETLLGGFVVGVEVGMIFARKFPVRLFDFVLVGVFCDAQRFVVVVFGVSA